MACCFVSLYINLTWPDLTWHICSRTTRPQFSHDASWCHTVYSQFWATSQWQSSEWSLHCTYQSVTTLQHSAKRCAVLQKRILDATHLWSRHNRPCSRGQRRAPRTIQLQFSLLRCWQRVHVTYPLELGCSWIEPVSRHIHHGRLLADTWTMLQGEEYGCDVTTSFALVCCGLTAQGHCCSRWPRPPESRGLTLTRIERVPWNKVYNKYLLQHVVVESCMATAA